MERRESLTGTWMLRLRRRESDDCLFFACGRLGGVKRVSEVLSAFSSVGSTLLRRQGVGEGIGGAVL